MWLASRLAVLVLSVGGAWTLSGRQAGNVAGFTESWDRWDVGLLVKIARFGYQGYPQDYPDVGVEAFFPGHPLLLRAVHLVVPDWVAAGLLISLVAGAVACAALARLAALDLPGNGSRAVLYLVLSPFAVFLFAGYSEALFLALALPGWLAARQGRWAMAGVLVALAASVRVTGCFLAVALVVEYVVTRRRDGLPLLTPVAGWLLAPLATVGAYVVYLHALTGDWLRWPHAQAEGWGREFTAPWNALVTTLGAARNQEQGAEYAWSFRLEVLAVLIGVGLATTLLVRRRWSEATYVGLSVLALATSSYYLSVGRATLLWWPLFVLLAAAGARRRWVHATYLAVSAPLMALLVLTFTSGRWVG